MKAAWMLAQTKVVSLQTCRYIMFLIAIVLVSCTNRSFEDATKELQSGTGRQVIAGQNALAFDLLREVSDGKNIVFSPYSVGTALKMLYFGASQPEKKLLKTRLGLTDLSDSDVEGTVSQIDTLLSHAPGDTQIETANSLWLNMEANKSFTDRCERALGGQVEMVDFNAKGVARINDWISQKTNGKVQGLVHYLPVPTAMVIVNAVYFNGKWKDEFDPKDTQASVFHLLGGNTVVIPFMGRRGTYKYYEDDDLQVVTLPYRDERFAFVILLPTKPDGIRKLTKSLNSKRWAKVTSHMHAMKGSVTVPRFEARFSTSLAHALTKLGLGSLFEPGERFSEALKESAWLGDVQLGAFIDVNEKGTEAAAAATEEDMKGAELSIDLVADHPFIYAIWDKQTNLILFLGALYDPSQAGT